MPTIDLPEPSAVSSKPSTGTVVAKAAGLMIVTILVFAACSVSCVNRFLIYYFGRGTDGHLQTLILHPRCTLLPDRRRKRSVPHSSRSSPGTSPKEKMRTPGRYLRCACTALGSRIGVHRDRMDIRRAAFMVSSLRDSGQGRKAIKATCIPHADSSSGASVLLHRWADDGNFILAQSFPCAGFSAR